MENRLIGHDADNGGLVHHPVLATNFSLAELADLHDKVTGAMHRHAYFELSTLL